MRGAFLDYDDRQFLIGNPHIQSLTWESLRWMFSSAPMGMYHPLSWLSYALDFRLWGMDPWGWHLTNILLHAANAALFFLLCGSLLGLALPRETREQPARTRLLCALAALLFSVHPLRAESVAWINERRDVLAGVFYLGAVLSYLRAHAAHGPRRSWLALSLGSYALSLLSKGIGISLPATLLILDHYPLRRLGHPRDRLSPAAVRVLAEKLPYAALAAAFLVRGILAASAEGSMRGLQEYGFAARAASAFYGLAFYARKTLWPAGLSPLYEWPWRLDPLELQYLASAAAVVAAAALLWRRRRDWPASLAAAGHYLAALLPVLGLLPFGIQLAADRYSYFSCLPWPVLAAGAALTARGRAARAGPFVMAATALLLAALTWRQCRHWRDSVSLWSRVVAVDPDSAVGRRSLGLALASAGRLEEASAHFREAAKLRPRADALSDLGLSLMGIGRMPEAMRALEEALRLDPAHFKTRLNLSLVLAGQGRLREAEKHCRLALEADPSSAEAHNNLGTVLGGTGRTAQAVAEFKEAARLKPDYAQARRNLGLALLRLGRKREALEALREAKRLDPRPFPGRRD